MPIREFTLYTKTLRTCGGKLLKWHSIKTKHKKEKSEGQLPPRRNYKIFFNKLSKILLPYDSINKELQKNVILTTPRHVLILLLNMTCKLR